jgi:2-(1,2-epoxy-1,2-dihydrophenyl)acetyl-CoA isomerase
MIDTQVVGSIAVFRFDRAEKRNALTPHMLSSLCKAVETAASARAIVLSGVGEVFCAGFDLTLCRGDDGALRDMLTGLSRAIVALRNAPCPVVVSAHGAAIAGGCALLGGADVVVTTDDARIGYPVVRLGISPAVSAPFARLAMGDGPARVRMLDPGLIDGRAAVRLGLAHESVASGCEARAIDIARGFEAKPRDALGHTKRWLNEIDGSLDALSIERGLETSLALVGTPELEERLAALWRKT